MQSNPINSAQQKTRRQFLGHLGQLGIGTIALNCLLNDKAAAINANESANPMAAGGQSQARDFSAHVRRSAAFGYV